MVEGDVEVNGDQLAVRASRSLAPVLVGAGEVPAA